MRERILASLILLWPAVCAAQTTPPGWKILKDGRGLCQIAVPPEWTPLGENSGAAVFHDSTTAIAVVTAQPEQEFKPLPEPLQKAMDIPKNKMFENSAKHVFYQDRTSRGPEEFNAFSASVPAGNGTCSCRVTALPSVAEDNAKKVALSLAPAAAATSK